MPSKSKAQHNLMAMVANNPAAAKRLGIPQSVGKDYMKADKRKGKKFRIGGPSSYSGDDDSSEGMQMSARRMPSSEMNFKEAFRAARKAGDDTFTWKGKKYTTELAGSSKPAAAAAPKADKTETKVETSTRGRGGAGERPTKSIAEQLDSKPGSGAGFRNLMAKFGTSGQRERMRSMGYGEDESDSEESVAMRRARIAREVAESSRGPGARYTPVQGMSMAERRMQESGRMRHGGSVKKYKSGGSVSSASKRADGCATKGKTRGKFI